ncbi:MULTISPECIES: hypothetical protein [unclassified Curtobacterium]|uniref:hypothetical protein n=1 Tax=unclassified Curtobacterium TaxID=257496 RepID=UPI0015E8AFA3|nr:MULTISPECIES: hypothetical protein [unclassified Curtobacterium]
MRLRLVLRVLVLVLVLVRVLVLVLRVLRALRVRVRVLRALVLRVRVRALVLRALRVLPVLRLPVLDTGPRSRRPRQRRRPRASPLTIQETGCFPGPPALGPASAS